MVLNNFWQKINVSSSALIFIRAWDLFKISQETRVACWPLVSHGEYAVGIDRRT